ncbi:amidase [Burkholderia sp. WAC0059]|uniref:amidase n=1 Tax=Burkholderia sp. WAC0059 TaxID=2066022 RepID=UPI002155930B|nr:amidase [Burkholderia sp. WAC0059]
MAARDAELHAWAHVSAADVLSAPEGDALAGPLAGVPLGVKDIIDVAGMPTRCQSPACDDRPVQFDASIVSLLRAAGAVPVGKTVTAEFAFMTPGPTRNPVNPEHTPGGSSSGSAAAVAAGMVPIALGTQTGGSMIRPAAYCGVVGFKPTHGAIGRLGAKVLCESLDVIGWYGTNVADVAAVGDVLLPKPSARPGAPRELASLRIAFLPGHPAHEIEAGADAVLNRAKAALARQGASVQTIGDFAIASELLAAHDVIMHYEFSRSMLPVASGHARLLSPRLMEAVKTGLAMPAGLYLEMKSLQAAQRTQYDVIFGDADFVLTSSAIGPAPQGLASTGPSAFNKGWSVLGWPCIHLPSAHDDSGLPLGVQLVGRPGSDAALIDFASVVHTCIDERADSVPR